MTGAKIIPINQFAQAHHEELTKLRANERRKEIGEMWARGEISVENRNLSLMWSIKR